MHLFLPEEAVTLSGYVSKWLV